MFALLQHVTAAALRTAQRALAEGSRGQRHAGGEVVSGAAVRHGGRRGWFAEGRGRARSLE